MIMGECIEWFEETSQSPTNVLICIATEQQTILAIIHVQRELWMNARMPSFLQDLVHITFHEGEEGKTEVSHGSGRSASMDHATCVLGIFIHPAVTLTLCQGTRILVADIRQEP